MQDDIFEGWEIEVWRPTQEPIELQTRWTEEEGTNMRNDSITFLERLCKFKGSVMGLFFYVFDLTYLIYEIINLFTPCIKIIRAT